MRLWGATSTAAYAGISRMIGEMNLKDYSWPLARAVLPLGLTHCARSIISVIFAVAHPRIVVICAASYVRPIGHQFS